MEREEKENCLVRKRKKGLSIEVGSAKRVANISTPHKSMFLDHLSSIIVAYLPLVWCIYHKL